MESSPLPEFGRPPLNEIFLGVQFATPQFYSPALVTEVWSLYRSRFSRSEVQGPIGPRFETFGGPSMANAPGFQILGAPPAPRYWFLTPDGNELVQFQTDRLLHNWRQVDGAPAAKYPRFPNVLGAFASELNAFADYVVKHGEALSINQAELTYVNRIYEASDRMPDPADWLNFVAMRDVEAASGVLQRVVADDAGQPVGRDHRATPAETGPACDFARSC